MRRVGWGSAGVGGRPAGETGAGTSWETFAAEADEKAKKDDVKECTQ